MRWHRLLSGLVLALILGGIAQLAHGLYLPAKAWLAQRLLRNAWHETLAGDNRVRPWPWADTWPVARLQVTRYEVDLIVLAGDTGRTLAFGPGLNLGLAQPGEGGLVLISAHRDTHFRFLREVAPGDVLVLQSPDSALHHYRVDDARVMDASTAALDVEADQLVLVTCYPFDALVPGGPLRFVVTATPVAPSRREIVGFM